MHSNALQLSRTPALSDERFFMRDEVIQHGPRRLMKQESFGCNIELSERASAASEKD